MAAESAPGPNAGLSASSDEHESDGEKDAHGDKSGDAGDHEGEGHGDEHGDEHGAHDPFDLSHGNASAGLENPADWKFDMAIYTFVVFLIVLAVLFKFAWGPIMDGLERRERNIARMIHDAEQKLEKASEHLRSYEAKLAEAAQEARELVDRAHRDAESAAERIRHEAEDVARREKERAVQEIGLAKEQALQELADHVSQNVFRIAGKVLEREVKPEDHRRLIQEALEKLPSKN